MANSNIDATTRELWQKGVRKMVLLQLPIYAAMLDRRRIVWKGGTKIKHTAQFTDMASLGQAYGSNDPLTSSSKTLWKTMQWPWKKATLPINYGVDEYLENDGGNDTSPVALIPKLIEAGQEGMRKFMYEMMYSMADVATTDTKKTFQSIPDALEHANTYGGVARTAAAYTWWNGASLAGTWTDRNDVMPATIANFRSCMDVITRYAKTTPKNGDIIAVMGSSIFRAFQSQVEARHIYNREGVGMLAKYGFDAFYLDGVQFVKDPFLDTDPEGGTTTSGDLASEWFFLLNLKDWELRINPKRAFNITGLKWQAEQAGGKDEWLARIMLAGNLYCKKPNGSMWKSYVTT